eukprot:COSAG02_NODE_20470_length_830_cov_1.311902_2_plen_70_part_00
MSTVSGRAGGVADSRLLESSPGIDQDIIARFNKRFRDEYPRVSKPIICNGLQEVKVYDAGASAVGSAQA